MTSRLLTINVNRELAPYTNPWVALVCDECRSPIVIASMYSDVMLRTWVIGATPSRLAQAELEHACPVGVGTPTPNRAGSEAS